ncbi:MAG TPA: ABC transporter ATP-binding protein [Actinomycetota bacterium]|nr:ABC transporter ATP-binding protein [Actinomycetota bacterium]
MSTQAAELQEPQVPEPVEPVITITAMSKLYGATKAVDEMDLEVPAGAVYGLIGPNGAGKTTTFSILATLLAPTSGVAHVCGFDATNEPYEVRRVLGYMPDAFGLYDDIRVTEYLNFFASAYRQPPAQRRSVVPDLLELVDLGHKADEYVESLSRGMKQRLGLARALIHDPQVLILDEPASGLDPRARQEFRELVLELQRMGKTLVISSHILPELQQMCTHIGVLEAGRLLAEGSPDDILSKIGQGRAYRLRLASPGAQAQALEILERSDAVSGALCEGAECHFVLAGGEDQAAGILSEVIGAGILVSEFAETKTDLEDLFLKITRGVEVEPGD